MSAVQSYHLASLGVFGFDALEPVVLAALITEDPLLLIGNSGTGKTFLLNSLSEALGLIAITTRASSPSTISSAFLPGRQARRREVPQDTRHRLGRAFGADRQDQPLQARAPEPLVLAGARAAHPGYCAPAAALSLGSDEPVLDRPERRRGGLRGLRGARPGARRSVHAFVRAANWGELTPEEHEVSTATGRRGPRSPMTQARCARRSTPGARASSPKSKPVPSRSCST